MGGEGYALERALSDAALAQLRSMEKRARSDLPRRSPSDMFELSRRGVGDCMENMELSGCAAVSRNLTPASYTSRRWVKYSL